MAKMIMMIANKLISAWSCQQIKSSTHCGEEGSILWPGKNHLFCVPEMSDLTYSKQQYSWLLPLFINNEQ
jgi:hypothetical protein